ncbi:MAG: hypothetical protein H7345_09885 [Rubritepida sp.]|nr:hypothetical protein [Rubritepida sp.]
MTETSIRPDSPTSAEMVRWAFRTILGHHGVSADVVRFHQQAFPRFDQLCEGLKDSNEFAATYGPRADRPAPPPSAAVEADLRTAITSLYRAYLHREPDASGMADNLAVLRQMGGLAGVGHLASVFEQSTERALHDHLPACMRWITSGNGQPDEFNGRPVISLGSHCAPAMILKKNGLKQFSTPFDWIFSTPAMVRDCLRDQFRTLLSTRHHRPVTRLDADGVLEAVSAHTLYNERYGIVDPVFNHRDITRPEVLAYYRRCAARFLKVLRGGGPVTFLQCVIEASHGEAACREEFRATAALLRQMAPQASLAMFHLRLKGGIMPGLAVLEEDGPHLLFQLDTVSVLGALDFHEQIDQIGLMRGLRWHARRTALSDASRP